MSTFPIFIPIKKDSQRVPNKNFRDWGGKPLWRHTIDKYTTNKLQHVYISTDSEGIIKDCKDIDNVTAYNREEHLRGHNVSVCKLIADCIQRFDLSGAMAQIHVTNPFLKKHHVWNALKVLSQSESRSCFSCNERQVRFWRKESHGLVPVNHNPMNLVQTQDLPIYYEENSCFYIFRTEDVLKTGLRLCSNPLPIVIGSPYNLDIDTEEDWKFCEVVRG